MVDLKSAGFVEPAGLVAIAAIVDEAVEAGRQVRVIAPTDEDCRNYLSRMRLGSHLDRLGVGHDLGWVREHAVSSLSELRWFGSEAQLEQVAEAVVRHYQQAGTTVVGPLYEALFELAVNAVEHSGRSGGYVALQQYRSSGEVAFAVADAGVGLRNRLGAKTDVQAIALAAKKYQSSESGPGRGRGITGVIELTSQHQGSVTFLTGTALGRFAGGHWDPCVSTAASAFPGTLVNTRLSQREG